MPEIPAVRAAEQPLINLYRQAWRRIESQQQVLIDTPLDAAKPRRLRTMQRSVEQTMREIDPEADRWIHNQLPRVYADGGVVGAADMGQDFTWSQISQEAVEGLAGGLNDDLLLATKNVKASTKSLIRAIARDQALQVAIDGRTARQASIEMRRILNTHGIHAVRYSNGALHGLGEYAEMAIRTTTAKAYNFGTLNGAAAHGCRYFECFDGPDCGWVEHKSGEKALGKIVTRDQAMEYPISHPNCRRAFGARPDLGTKAQAQAATGSVTDEQIQAQRAADQRRGEAAARRNLRNRQKAVARAARTPATRVNRRAARIASRPTRST